MYYIISLAQTKRWEDHITLWRPHHAGYCVCKDMAGTYDQPKEGYHNSDDNMSIPVEVGDKLFIEIETRDGVKKKVLPNCKVVWKALNVKMTKNGLQKIKNK